MKFQDGRKLITLVFIFVLCTTLQAGISNGTFEADDGYGWAADWEIEGWQDQDLVSRYYDAYADNHDIYFEEPLYPLGLSVVEVSISQAGISISPENSYLVLDFKPLPEGPPVESDYLKLRLYGDGYEYVTTIWSNTVDPYESDARIEAIGDDWFQAIIDLGNYTDANKIAFEMKFTNDALLGNMHIDNIELTAVPAPGAVGLSVLGISLVGLFRRLKK